MSMTDQAGCTDQVAMIHFIYVFTLMHIVHSLDIQPESMDDKYFIVLLVDSVMKPLSYQAPLSNWTHGNSFIPRNKNLWQRFPVNV